ncbi:MAG: hypothetical protein MK085_03435 [Phycisphaerales bacterium]|nr:hypothetical protein [Phycisphaerales bacterium]
MRCMVACLGCLLPMAVGHGQVVYEDYMDHEGLGQRLGSMASADPGRVKVDVYGASRQGRPLYRLTLTGPDAGERPQLLVVAGLDGRHLMGTELAVRVAEQLLSEHPALLDEIDVLVLPRANPDAAEGNLGRLNAGLRGTARVLDADRDRLVDEDPPIDLDGNGVITQMRLLKPTLRHPATHLADPGEPRLLKTPDRAAGERAIYAIMTEGRDQDGDGRIAEDGACEVQLDGNFMHLWPEHATHAGPYPLSEPEAEALANLVMANPRIFAAVVYGPHDTVLNIPDVKAKDSSGRVPRELHGGDKALYESLGKLYREHTAQQRTTDADNAGSFHGWLYAHQGIPTVATTAWGRPDATAEAENPEADAEDQAPGEDEEDDGPAPVDGEAAGWLAYSDRDCAGAGFVEWKAFDHPQLGPVEIGGFVPGFRMNAPVAVVEELAASHAGFMGALAERRPRMVFEGPEVEPLGRGIQRVRLAIVNEGQLPVLTRMGRDNRATRPTAIRLNTPLDRVLEGKRVNLVRGLDADGGRVELEWVVRTGDEPLVIEIDDPIWGLQTINVNAAEGGAQ